MTGTALEDGCELDEVVDTPIVVSGSRKQNENTELQSCPERPQSSVVGSRGRSHWVWEGTPDPSTRVPCHEARLQAHSAVDATCAVPTAAALLAQRGRLFGLSLRNCATLAWCTTQSSNRLRI